jgi:S-adenosylmethionine hydrolase
MKGVILSICPEAILVDLTHEVPRHAVSAAAYVLNRCRTCFPSRTVHLVVVDPGVGSARRPLVCFAHGQYLVGPDNGLFADFHESDSASECFEITAGEYLKTPPSISPTFQGRDVFAPVAGHLARGIPPSAFGQRVFDPIRIEPSRAGSDVKGEIVWVDRFGNLISNLHPAPSRQHMAVSVKGREVPIVNHYEQGPPGLPAALVNSDHVLEIFINRGDAADALGAVIGTPIALVSASQQ